MNGNNETNYRFSLYTEWRYLNLDIFNATLDARYNKTWHRLDYKFSRPFINLKLWRLARAMHKEGMHPISVVHKEKFW